MTRGISKGCVARVAQRRARELCRESPVRDTRLGTEYAVPRVSFTPQLQRFLDAPPQRVEGDTVRAALEAVFAGNPRLRGYILDEHGRLRTHVTVFVGEATVQDRAGLSDPAGADTEIFVLQALSGG
jgi:hypothetical protein